MNTVSAGEGDGKGEHARIVERLLPPVARRSAVAGPQRPSASHLLRDRGELLQGRLKVVGNSFGQEDWPSPGAIAVNSAVAEYEKNLAGGFEDSAAPALVAAQSVGVYARRR